MRLVPAADRLRQSGVAGRSRRTRHFCADGRACRGENAGKPDSSTRCAGNLRNDGNSSGECGVAGRQRCVQGSGRVSGRVRRRELSDEEIRALAKEDLETARDRISTGGDFAAWLIAMGGQIYCDVTSNDEGQRTVGADFAYEWVHEMLTSTFAASLAVCVLGDDLPGIGVVAAQVADNDGIFLCGNLLPADGGYYLISFDALTDEWKAVVEADRI